jgi:phosphatidylinositol 4-kinase
MERLENDLDYLQRVGSVWQLRLAFDVKAKIMTTHLCCTVYDEDIADTDLLLTWLDATLNDEPQTAYLNLASTALKAMSILAKGSPDLASNLARSLPRVIVQGGFDDHTATVAAESLASILSHLTQDAIITTMYSLGNVLSAGTVPERTTSNSPALNGTIRNSKNLDIYQQQTTGSTISLTPSDADEPHLVYATVVQTIVSIARSCQDEKITALALSMLVQKIGRTTRPIDEKIIAESALLGLQSGPSELKTLLKLYDKLSHDAIVKGDSATIEAVSGNYSSHQR